MGKWFNYTYEWLPQYDWSEPKFRPGYKHEYSSKDSVGFNNWTCNCNCYVADIRYATCVEGKKLQDEEREYCHICKAKRPPIPRKQSSGCFITTATLKSLKENDDYCIQLETFRNFRDSYMINKLSDIDKYYELAPKIVSKIDNDLNNEEEYKRIWKDYLEDCFQLILINKNFEAYELYKKMVSDLSMKHLKN